MRCECDSCYKLILGSYYEYSALKWKLCSKCKNKIIRRLKCIDTYMRKHNETTIETNIRKRDYT